MDRKLIIKAVLGVATMPLIFGLVTFLPAGTFDYWQGKLFIATFFVITTVLTLYLMKYDPALLERRLKAGPTFEKRGPQKTIMLVMSVGFFLMIVIGGLDHRFGWTHVPNVLVYAGNILMVLSYVLILEVFRENSFASATIETAKDQKVISTGLYGIVRHPMYSASLLFMLGIPLALASWWSLALCVSLAPNLLWRIFDEEKMLRDELEGYGDYCKKVRFRLIPWIF